MGQVPRCWKKILGERYPILTTSVADVVMGRFGAGEFVEVHVSTSLETCEKRDPKGLYKKVIFAKI